MRPCTMVLALAFLAAAAPGATLLQNLSGGRLENLHVRKFLIGRLEPNTDRFIARSGRNEQAVLRDEVLYFEFSSPLDFDTVDSRTVQIGIPTGPGTMVEAPGSFYRYVVKAFDPVSSTFVPKRAWRNRLLFASTRMREDDPTLWNPYGFEVDTPYIVILPGAESGYGRTLRTAGGAPLQRTFRTTFRTTDAHQVDYLRPTVILLEASDAPGIPLQGRVGVDPLADIVAYFDEPMDGASFDPATTFRVLDVAAGSPVPGTVLPFIKGRTATFRIDSPYEAGAREFEATLTTGLTDAFGNPLDGTVTARFTTR